LLLVFIFLNNEILKICFILTFFTQELENPEKTAPVLIGDVIAPEFSHCRPRLSGIPPHVAIVCQMVRLQKTIEEHTSGMILSMKDELDRRGVGGETFQANALLRDVKKLHDDMGKMIAGGTVGGGGGTGEYDGLNNRLPVPTVLDPSSPAVIATNCERRTMYVWGSPQPRMHNVPEGFELPRMNLQTLIVYWHCGSRQPMIPPLRYIKSYDFPQNKKNMGIVICQMRKLMFHVHRAGEVAGIDCKTKEWTRDKAQRLFEKVFRRFHFPSFGGRRVRYEEILWKTYHNHLQKNKFKLVGEI
jgi:hypothetical protein